MPRLPPQLFASARKLHKLLPVLLPVTREIGAAQSELRWLQEAFGKTGPRLVNACVKRGRKQYPLQYLLGSQPFERLDILCKPGVLIPRWETEEWAVKLAQVVKGSSGLQIVDLCSGTGCIPLLLATAVSGARITGVDISETATDLFTANIEHNKEYLGNNAVSVVQADLLKAQSLTFKSVDIVTANPPYIPTLYSPDTPVERSVRLYEPKLALIGDNEFYTAIFDHALKMDAQALVCEVGEQYQIDHLFKLAEQENSRSTSEHALWSFGQFNDASGTPRVAVLWKPKWSSLASMCSPMQ